MYFFFDDEKLTKRAFTKDNIICRNPNAPFHSFIYIYICRRMFNFISFYFIVPGARGTHLYDTRPVTFDNE